MPLTINEINKLQIVFIVGRGRSGTSLLQTMFDANPYIKTANESPFILHLKQKYSRVKNWNNDKINEFIIDLYKDKKFTFLWGINPDDLKKNINLYSQSDLSFPILCKLVYLTISSPFPKEKTTLIVDKNPLYSPFTSDLIEVFPDAKFIHLIRDYRDNINSNREAFKIKNIIVLAHKWKRYNKSIDKQKEKYPSQFYTVRYEDLVSSPENKLTAICDFLNISFNSQMLDFHDTTRIAYTDKTYRNGIMSELVQQIHSNLLNPITTSQIDKWKMGLSTNEIKLIEYITGEYAKKYHYYPSTHNTKFYFVFISWNNYFKDQFSHLVYKTYYKLPFIVRDLLRKISEKLYDKLGYSNSYNEVSVRYRNK